MRATCRIPFSGHPNVRSTHRTTTEITTEESLTSRGDCIIGVGAGMGCSALPDAVKQALMKSDSRVCITIRVGARSFAIQGRGDPGLSLEHRSDIVIRKSTFLCPRTLAVECDAASVDMPREMVMDLRNCMGGVMTIDVDCP